MYVERVGYKRTWNLGDYESVSLDASIVLEEGDDPAEAWALAKSEVAAQSAPVIAWRDRKRVMEAEHVINGLPAHLREPVRAMIATTSREIDGNGNGDSH